MLISGFFFLFVACIVYMHVDLSISKSSASYLAKLQWDEVSECSIQYFLMIYNSNLLLIKWISRCSRSKHQFSKSKVSSVDAYQYMINWKHHCVIFLGQGMSNPAKQLEKLPMLR